LLKGSQTKVVQPWGDTRRQSTQPAELVSRPLADLMVEYSQSLEEIARNTSSPSASRLQVPLIIACKIQSSLTCCVPFVLEFLKSVLRGYTSSAMRPLHRHSALRNLKALKSS
jgi:hypothetical protein